MFYLSQSQLSKTLFDKEDFFFSLTKELEVPFFLFPDKFTVKCQGKISLFQEVKSTAQLEEKIKDDNVKLTDNFDSSLGND